MKTFASVFVIILLSMDLYAQTPLAFTGGSADMGFDHYTQGYDETLFTPQVMALKGKVRSCIVEEIIPDSKLSAAWDDSLRFQSYQLSYTFNNSGKAQQLDINFVTMGYRQPDEIKTAVRHGFVWDGPQLKVMSFMETFLNRSFLSVLEYNPNNTVKSEYWLAGWDGIFTGRLPFAIKYDYQKDGSCEVNGILEADNTKENVLKYTKRFDAKGRITYRCLYARDLRTLTPNNPQNAEVFHYAYNAEGKISKMTYQKGNAKPIVYEYDYKDPDVHGNYKLMQVRNESKVLLYEFGWEIEYFE